MRTELEMISLIHSKAERLRRNRSRRRLAALSATSGLATVALVLASHHGGRGDSVVVAVPAAVVSDQEVVDRAALSRAVIGHIEIPAIDASYLFVEGVAADDLELGPGHYPETVMPGHVGNAAIAGHRASSGAPFRRVDELVAGDRIEVTTLEGAFVYLVTGTRVVRPDAVEVLDADFWSDQGSTATLTLTTEHRASTGQRMVVGAALIGEPVG